MLLCKLIKFKKIFSEVTDNFQTAKILGKITGKKSATVQTNPLFFPADRFFFPLNVLTHLLFEWII